MALLLRRWVDARGGGGPRHVRRIGVCVAVAEHDEHVLRSRIGGLLGGEIRLRCIDHLRIVGSRAAYRLQARAPAFSPGRRYQSGSGIQRSRFVRSAVIAGEIYDLVSRGSREWSRIVYDRGSAGA